MSMPKDVLPLRTAFQQSKGGPVMLGEHVVYRALHFAVLVGGRIILEIEDFTDPPEQVLQLVADNCIIGIRKGKSRTGKIWLSEWGTGPIEIELLDVVDDAKLCIWNATGSQLHGNTNDSWGSYGFIVESIGENRLRVVACGGPPERPVTFDAIEMVVSFTNAKLELST